MNKHAGHRPFAVAAALLLIGALAWDVPVGYVLFIGLILACPLMMIFMMRRMGAGDQGTAVKASMPTGLTRRPMSLPALTTSPTGDDEAGST